MGSLRVRFQAGVFYLSGEFDVAAIDDFAAGTKAALDGDGPVLFDLSELTFLDSSGLNAIAQLASWCEARGVILRNPHPFVRKVIDLVRLDQMVGIRVETDEGDGSRTGKAPSDLSRPMTERRGKDPVG